MVSWSPLWAPTRPALRVWPSASASTSASTSTVYIKRRIASPPIFQHGLRTLAMAPSIYPKYEGGAPEADHLCVLVHGVSLCDSVVSLPLVNVIACPCGRSPVHMLPFHGTPALFELIFSHRFLPCEI